VAFRNLPPLKHWHGLAQRELQNIIIKSLGGKPSRLRGVIPFCDNGIDTVQRTEKYVRHVVA